MIDRVHPTRVIPSCPSFCRARHRPFGRAPVHFYVVATTVCIQTRIAIEAAAKTLQLIGYNAGVLDEADRRNRKWAKFEPGLKSRLDDIASRGVQLRAVFGEDPSYIRSVSALFLQGGCIRINLVA